MTPRRKQPGQDHRTDSEIAFNHAIASRRVSVEQVIAHLKNFYARRA